MEDYSFRLLPHQDILVSINDFVRAHGIAAGCILTCAGSLSRAAIRFAGRAEVTILEDDFEIVSLCGTVALAGTHLHIAISDAHGRTIGGHLTEGSLVRTTAEIVLVVFPDLVYRWELDAQSGFNELVVYSVHRSETET